MILEDLLERLEDIEVSDTYLYFITRVLKQNQKKNSKVLDKYLFKVYQVDINDEIRNHLYSLTQEQLSYLINKKTEVHEYVYRANLRVSFLCNLTVPTYLSSLLYFH